MCATALGWGEIYKAHRIVEIDSGIHAKVAETPILLTRRRLVADISDKDTQPALQAAAQQENPRIFASFGAAQAKQIKTIYFAAELL